MTANLRLRAGVMALLFGLGLVVAQPRPGRAESPFGAIEARAGADALRLGVAMKKFLIVENFVDAGGPTAQSHLTSLGAESFAALPDPGGLVLNYNTFVGLATGSGLPFDYPLYAQAKYPGSPEAGTADPSGAFKVSAKAGADSAEALARMRPTAGDAAITGALARSSVTVDGRTVTATSETGADAVSLAGGALKLSGVASRSVTTRTAGRSEPTTETALTVDLITVGDKRIRYTGNGFEFLGTPVPVPSDTVAATLAGALKPLGVQIDVVRPAPIAGGMKAAVLEIRQAYPLPAGEAQLVLRFGGAMSSITAEDGLPGGDLSTPVRGAAPPADSTGTGTGTGTAAGSQGAASSAFPFSSPTGGLGSGRSAGSSAVGYGSAPAASSTVAADGTGAAVGSPLTSAADGAPLATAAPASLRSHRRSVEGPYAVLVAAGLAIVLLSAEWARRSAAATLWLGP
ncbi:MAG: hypothetical protein QOE80_3465 [Actinomycetota bacterium]|nr:hypothetical protein [Actinomycetota bacterium]